MSLHRNDAKPPAYGLGVFPFADSAHHSCQVPHCHKTSIGKMSYFHRGEMLVLIVCLEHAQAGDMPMRQLPAEVPRPRNRGIYKPRKPKTTEA
jgi:hypothetical protein